VRPNGLRVEKMRVPLGVVLFIYESRPNVTSDAAALCLKSGNAIILRGGKEAMHSNAAIAAIIAKALAQMEIDPAAVQLIESSDRALLPPLLKLNDYIDIVIPRGGEGLIRTVVEESTIPVLKHFTGNCHIYIDAATESMEAEVRGVCVNAKTSYPGGAVCNAVEKLLFHHDAAQRLLAKVCQDLVAKGDRLLEKGDIVAARTMYQRAAEMGSGSAALTLGATYDPTRLWSLGALGMVGNKERARQWYARASELGNPDAKAWLMALGN